MLVNPFIPRPLRCFKCQRFGHKGSKCKSKVDRCIQCGAPEKHENCQKEKKCSNCLEAHSASDKTCRVYRETQQILRHQAENGGTFANSRSVLFPLGTTYSGVVKRQSKLSHNKADPGRSTQSDTSGSNNSASTSTQTPQPSDKGGRPEAELKHTASNDAAEVISPEKSSASGSSVDSKTPSADGDDVSSEETTTNNEKKDTETEHSELEFESMDEEILPEKPSASIESSDKNPEAIENSMEEVGGLVLGFPSDFLHPTTSKEYKNSDKNVSAFQKEANKQHEKTQKAINALLQKVCQKCFTLDMHCQCKSVHTKDTKSNTGFKDGVKVLGPACKRHENS